MLVSPILAAYLAVTAFLLYLLAFPPSLGVCHSLALRFVAPLPSP
jgi:hypothetical protein